MAGGEQFRLFGDKTRFALEISLASDQPTHAVPLDCEGSWGAWRLWLADVNLCRLQLSTQHGVVEVQEIRWFVAALVRWLVASWMPLLHEARLPEGNGWGDRRPRWARLAYLAMVERSGDTDRFRGWQSWAARHALRSASEGGMVPDIFFQRIGDDIELTWGDRLQPGGEAATYLVDDGVARVSVDDFAEALLQAIDWCFDQPSIKRAAWSSSYADMWSGIKRRASDLEPLYWYLDARAEPGPLSAAFLVGFAETGRDIPQFSGPWLGTLSPEIAMFGDLTPHISQIASVTLLREFDRARTEDPEPAALSPLVVDEPAWTSTSPWENGYSLALDILDEADPDASADTTNLEMMLDNLSIAVRDVALGREGPRGVALAGPKLRPTILVNIEHPMNQGRGRRFTEAHELCHILFDRFRARPLAHSSTPWAAPSVEQRANAFAAMLLMPTYRAKRPPSSTLSDLSDAVSILARKLKVSRVALCRHLANLGEIESYEYEYMIGNRRGDQKRAGMAAGH